MRILLMILLAVVFHAGQVMAKDDGGFGSARFSSQAPVALGTTTHTGTPDVIAVVPMASPADIEPASGEEDITPEEEILVNGNVIQNSEHQAEPVIIQKDITVR